MVAHSHNLSMHSIICPHACPQSLPLQHCPQLLHGECAAQRVQRPPGRIAFATRTSLLYHSHCVHQPPSKPASQTCCITALPLNADMVVYQPSGTCRAGVWWSQHLCTTVPAKPRVSAAAWPACACLAPPARNTATQSNARTTLHHLPACLAWLATDYVMLGINERSSVDDVKSAFRARAKVLHPDVNKQVCRRGEQA